MNDHDLKLVLAVYKSMGELIHKIMIIIISSLVVLG